MKEFETCLNRFRRMDEMIRMHSSGTPKEFASKIGVSVRTLYDYLSILKDVLKKSDVILSYSNSLRFYIYDKAGKLDIKFCWTDK